jgi:hypothetical protein
VLRKDFALDKQDRLLRKYARNELSQAKVCKALNWTPWDFLAELKSRNLHLNVELEDWLDSTAMD